MQEYHPNFVEKTGAVELLSNKICRHDFRHSQGAELLTSRTRRSQHSTCEHVFYLLLFLTGHCIAPIIGG